VQSQDWRATERHNDGYMTRRTGLRTYLRDNTMRNSSLLIVHGRKRVQDHSNPFLGKCHGAWEASITLLCIVSMVIQPLHGVRNLCNSFSDWIHLL